MKETLRLVIVLTVICLGAGFLLAVVNQSTADRIREVRAAKKLQAIGEVLGVGETDPAPTREDYATADGSNTFYVVRDNGRLVSAAFEARSPNGYGGDIALMAGISADGTLLGISILEQKETPGLGAKLDTDDFKAGFVDRAIQTTRWRVDKDGGDIQGITAATISSRAAVEAVNLAIAAFQTHEAELVGGKH